MMTTTEFDTLVPPANGTDDREARSYHWYAARTQMNCERKVEKRFQQLALETYLPIQEEVHQWSDRKKKVQRLVIPMILFVRVNSKDITKFLGRKDNQFYGFISIDRLGRIPAKIPDKDINTLKYMLGATDKSVIFEQQVIGVGDSVKIVRGVFKGLIGNIQTMKDGTVYLVVDMDKLGFVKAEINLSDCSKIEEDGRFKKAVASL